MALDESQGSALLLLEFRESSAPGYRSITRERRSFVLPAFPRPDVEPRSGQSAAWAAAHSEDLHIATLIRAAGVVYTAFLPPKKTTTSKSAVLIGRLPRPDGGSGRPLRARSQ